MVMPKFTLHGKVTILKSLALPKIQYAASCLPITNDIVKQTNQIVSKFLEPQEAKGK
jgi:hypothetical protein